MGALFASVGWLLVFGSGFVFIMSWNDTSDSIARDIQRALDVSLEDMNQFLIYAFLLGVVLITLGRILKFVSGVHLRRDGLGVGLHAENPLPRNGLLSGAHDHGVINANHAVGTPRPAQAQANANSMVFNNLVNLMRIAPESMLKQVEQAYQEGKITNEQYQNLRRTMNK